MYDTALALAPQLMQYVDVQMFYSGIGVVIGLAMIAVSSIFGKGQ